MTDTTTSEAEQETPIDDAVAAAGANVTAPSTGWDKAAPATVAREIATEVEDG